MGGDFVILIAVQPRRRGWRHALAGRPGASGHAIPYRFVRCFVEVGAARFRREGRLCARYETQKPAASDGGGSETAAHTPRRTSRSARPCAAAYTRDQIVVSKRHR